MRISKIFIWLSVLAGFLMAYGSLMGAFVESTYAKETVNWAAQAIGQDYVNIFLAFPLLLITALKLKSNSLKALLLWLGVLLYLIYSYVLYAFFVHFGTLFPVYVAILGLSFYSFIGALVGLDWQKIGQAFKDAPVKPASILLMVVGCMFYLLWFADIFGALWRGGLPQDLDKIGLLVNPVQVLDMALLLPGAIIVSILVRKGDFLGQVLAVPFLAFFQLMGVAIISMMIVLSQKGFPLAVPQMVIMAVIILISSIITVNYLKNIKAA